MQRRVVGPPRGGSCLTSNSVFPVLVVEIIRTDPIEYWLSGYRAPCQRRVWVGSSKNAVILMIVRHLRRLVLSVLVVASMASHALTQNVVQLPTFHFTTVDTTVSVPDGGSAYLGGILSASSGINSSGVPILGKLPGLGRLFGNRAIGRDVSANSMRVHATIIDLNEMDDMILGQAAARRSHVGQVSATDLKAYFLSQHVGRRNERLFEPAPQRPAPLSVAAIRRTNELAVQQRDDEAHFYFEKGRKAEADGKAGVAKIFYQMAARRAAGDFKSLVLARLDRVTGNAPQVATVGR